ncbi:MutS protein 1, partial [Rhizina undulata]
MSPLTNSAWNRRFLLKLSHLPRSAVCLSRCRTTTVLPGITQSSPLPCRHYAKVVVSKKLAELPQGALQPLEPFPKDDEKPLPAFPPVMEQALQNMRSFPNCVLLTRVGGFYELYFEQAEEIAPMLGIKVAWKSLSAGRGEVAMAGFPFSQLDRYLKVLVQDLGKYVAICEEYPNLEREAMSEIATAVGLSVYERRVSRIVTPGTLIDEKFMDPYENNFLLAIAIGERIEDTEDKPGESEVMEGQEGGEEVGSIKDLHIGLAWLDLSTGDFFTQQSCLTALSADIARIGPREVVLDETLQSNSHGRRILKYLEDERYFITFYPRNPTSVQNWGDMLESKLSQATIKAMEPAEVDAGGALLDYVKARLPGMTMKLQPPIRRNAKDTLIIDANSMRGLEIRNTFRDGRSKGSLIHTVKRTATKSGSRLLQNWLSSPITSMSIINHRLNLVELFLNEVPLREALIRCLQRTHDSHKIVQKFSIGRGDVDDLVALARTIEATQQIYDLLASQIPSPADKENDTQASIESLVKRFEIPIALANKITNSVDEEGLMEKQRIEESEVAQLAARAEAIVALAEKGEKDEGILESRGSAAAEAAAERKKKRKRKAGRLVKEVDREKEESWTMKRSASKTLLNLHKALEELEAEKVALEKRLRTDMDVPSFTLRWSPGLGHHCHVKGRDIKSEHPAMNGAKNVGLSKSTKSFHLPDWTHLGTLIDQARLRIRAEEATVFQLIRKQVIKQLVKLRRNAQALDELDIACSFAVLAQEQNFVRPILNLGVTHKIFGGRHPVVEAGLRERGKSFTANDCFVGGNERLWLITG